MLKYLLLLCLLASPCAAQQQPIPTVAETAIQINNVIGQWSQTLTQQSRVIDDLQKQLATAQARIKELEVKPEKPNP